MDTNVATDPAVNFARRTIKKYHLRPPIDAKALLLRYAKIEFVRIPFEGVDGISLDLKVPGKKPRVVINKNSSPLRRRFTMAHELGHILIPWHIGTIFDDTRIYPSEPTDVYWSIEAEANKFAAELLMPESWIDELISETPDLSEIHRTVSEACETSLHSSAIKLSRKLPENIVFASERAGRVEFSGKSSGTLANALTVDDPFTDEAYNYRDHHYVSNVDARRLHWWVLPKTIHIDSSDAGSWRDVLESILQDALIPEMHLPSVKQTISGIIGYTYSKFRGSGAVDMDSLVAALKQRFNYRPGASHERFIRAVVRHEAFDIFLKKRVEALLSSRPQ